MGLEAWKCSRAAVQFAGWFGLNGFGLRRAAMALGGIPTVPICLPVALAASQLLRVTLPQPSLSFFPFS